MIGSKQLKYHENIPQGIQVIQGTKCSRTDRRMPSCVISPKLFGQEIKTDLSQPVSRNTHKPVTEDKILGQTYMLAYYMHNEEMPQFSKKLKVIITSGLRRFISSKEIFPCSQFYLSNAFGIYKRWNI